MCDHCQCNHAANHSQSDRYTQKPALHSREVHRRTNLFSCRRCIGSFSSVMSLFYMTPGAWATFRDLSSYHKTLCLDTQERRDPLSRQGSPTGKIIPLSRHGKSPSKQSHMTERILEFIRINHREPSLGEIQSWGCARQTAVNSREAARTILRREVASQESAALEHEGTHQ